MRKILLRTLLLCAMIVVMMIPGSASAKKTSATATPTISGANYSTTVKINLDDIPGDGTAKASEAAKFSSGYVSISSTGYRKYLRVKFTLQNGAEVDSVVATITKSGVATPVELDLYDTASSGLLTYRGEIDGTVTQVDINLLHVCKFDYTQIPATTTKATCTEDGTLTRTCINCNGTTTTIDSKATGHAFTKKDYDSKYLQSAATCTDDAVYVYSCCYCGEAGTETFKDTGTATGHKWGEYEITKAPTCTVAGEKTRTCETCQATETEEISATGHDWGEFETTKAPTCTTAGEKTRTCKTCQATDTEEIKALGHDWGEYETTTAPTCTTAGVKTRTCETCQTTDTEEIPATGHKYTNYVSDDNATCTEDGTKTAICDVCKTAKNTVTDPNTATGHKYMEKEDPNYLKSAATCAADAVYYKSCSKCGLKSDEETFTAEGTKTSEHTWGEYTTTKAATCTEKGTESRTCTVCNETESRDIEATGHEWGEFETTKASTCTEAGVETRTCTKCNATETKELSLAAHQFTEENAAKEYLKSAATCTSGAVYYKSCSVCGEAGTDTFVSGDPIAHTWGDYVTTTQASCTEGGVKTRTCSICQTTETATIPATGHQYSDYVSDNNATCTEDGTKTQTCAVCNDKHTVANPGSAKGHQWNAGVVTKEPTEEETGSKTFTCTVCNTTRTEVIAKLPHTHAYTESVVNDNTLAQSATCTSAARYYKSCKCGDISRDATFESGNPLPHSFTNYVYDGNATCTADGTKTATCDSCGQAKDTVVADGTATGHLWDKGQVTVEPTVDHEGEMTYTCQNCKETKTETLAKLEPEKPNPVDPTPGTTDPTTPSKDNTAAGNRTLTASTDAAKNLEKQTETPRTSDDSALMLWTALLLLSGVSLTSAGLIRRCR